MISRIQSKFGTAGLVVAIVALVVAFTGAAFAATGLNSKQKKEVTKIAKKYAGKQGPVGPAGPAGPQGAPGAKGDTGAQGPEGPEGEQGIQGKQGIQGEPGEDGEDGESGFTATLPSGETETGAWAIGFNNESSYLPVSFNIPLAQAPEGMFFVKKDGTEKTTATASVPPANCKGSVANPTAPPGVLCFYAEEEVLTNPASTEEEPLPDLPGFFPNFPSNRLYKSGAVFFFGLAKSNKAWGTWAVTAP
jgi:Collagen triple helix repeat (20 copies)